MKALSYALRTQNEKNELMCVCICRAMCVRETRRQLVTYQYNRKKT